MNVRLPTWPSCCSTRRDHGLEQRDPEVTAASPWDSLDRTIGTARPLFKWGYAAGQGSEVAPTTIAAALEEGSCG
jgi:hypothetical protein